MLSDSNVRKINDQIENELRDLRFESDHEEQLEIIERIAQLKALMEPTPSVAEILAAIKDKHEPQLPNELNVDLKRIFDTFRR
jgi:vacuolar-type H+-ATPase subunit I/STV1